MNEKITIVRLARLLAAGSGRPEEVCEEVIRSLFREIAGGLQNGESVKVKGFGTFKLTAVEARKSVDVNSGEENEIPAHKRITFIPAKELASAVNAPFEMFETVILEERVTEEALMQAEAEGNEYSADALRGNLIIEEEKLDSVLDTIAKDYPEVMDEGTPCEEGGTQDVEDPNPDPEQESEAELGPEAESEPEPEPELEPEPEPESAGCVKRHAWIWYLICGVVVLVLALAILWWMNCDLSFIGLPLRTNDKSVTEIPQSAVESPSEDPDDNVFEELLDSGNLGEGFYDEDELEERVMAGMAEQISDPVPTKASDEIVHDTVTESRYLSIIAKEHYGNFNLWPYIYKENEKILGHPNRIRPGTRIVVPPLSKYGVDAKNKEDIEKAKRLGVEIYKKFDN